MYTANTRTNIKDNFKNKHSYAKKGGKKNGII